MQTQKGARTVRLTLQAVTVAIVTCALSLSAHAQPNPPDRPDTAFGGGPRMFGPDRNHLVETLNILGDLNLTPSFTLTAEQKQKIQAIRDDFRKQQDTWRAEHADQLKALEDQMAELRDAGGPPDPDQMREIMEERRDLMSTAPNGEDESEQVKALLTADQLKQFQTHLAALEQEREQMRQFNPRGRGRR
jgi:Spy/CpxP family protein refolding chaperone